MTDVATLDTHGLLGIPARHGAPLRTILFAMLKLASYKDFHTSGHLRRVRDGTVGLATVLRDLGVYQCTIDDAYLDNLRAASALHDIGKVSVPDSVLLKAGMLNSVEVAEMRTHAALGGTLLEQTAALLDSDPTLYMAADIAHGHHEHYDGGGYPRGLVGDQIPLSARIVAVVDVFDALVSWRPYKAIWAERDAISFLEDQAGRQFDPVLVRAFISWREAISDANSGETLDYAAATS